MLKAKLLDILLDFALHAGVGKVRILAGGSSRDQYVDLGASVVGGLGQLDIQPMLDFVLVFEPACGCFCGSERGKEDAGGRAQGGELARPGGGIARDKVGEFGWGRAASGGRGTAGDGVHASYSRIGNKAGEDLRALPVLRFSSSSSLGMLALGRFKTSRFRSFACRICTYHHTRTTDQCNVHHVCVSEVIIRVDVRCVFSKIGASSNQARRQCLSSSRYRAKLYSVSSTSA